MSKFKHTPGPWHVDPSWGPSEEHPEWAAINIGESWRSASGHIGSANARLIAAAPDMLHALNLALEYWQDRQQRYKNRAPVWVQEARDAIAKATGAGQ